MARERFPGQRNSLDALCRRFDVDNSHRELHGALLDAQLLTEVYLALTAGQGDLGFSLPADDAQRERQAASILVAHVLLTVHRASAEERILHAARLETIAKVSGGRCLWPVSTPSSVANTEMA